MTRKPSFSDKFAETWPKITWCLFLISLGAVAFLFFYNSFINMKSPSGKLVLEILLLILTLTGGFSFLNKPFVLKLLKLILAVLVFTISAQVALVPLIAPRISVEDSVMYGATLRGVEGFKAEEVTLRVRPPLFPMFPFVDIPVAYSNSTDIHSLDRNPLLDVSKNGNMLRVGVRTDGWTVEDLKTRVYIEHEAKLAFYESIGMGRVLEQYEKLSNFKSYSGHSLVYYFENKERVPIYLNDWYFSIDPKKNTDIWGTLLELVDSKHNCLRFFMADTYFDSTGAISGESHAPIQTDYSNNYELPNIVLKNNQSFNLKLSRFVGSNETFGQPIHVYAVPCAS